jgi:2-keto-4-pentenoate hydratase
MKIKSFFLLSIAIALPTLFLPSEVKGIAKNSMRSQTLPIAQADDGDNVAQTIAERYLKKLPLQDFTNHLTLEQARQIQAEFVALLIPSYGKIVGYKAGLTNQEIQAKFQTDRPVLGVLLEKMLLKSGAVVPINFGTRPLLEGDLMVRVSNEKINTAKTPQEVLSAIDAVIPFLEMPDLVYAEKAKLTASEIVAINVGARLGVMGQAIPINNSQEWQDKINKIDLVLFDSEGKQLARGNSRALLGDPLKVILWLRDDLKARGKSLKKGDLLSLGSLTPPIEIESAIAIRAQYSGLSDGDPVEVTVELE